MQQDAQYVLRAAARLAYGPESHAKFKLANRLINSMTDTADPRTMSSLSLDAAAAASHIPARGLLTVLQSDSCFVVKQASSSSGSYSVRLNAKALLEKGRSCTKAGVLAEELPDTEGYIDDQHPIRPGRPVCFHWAKYGRCAFNKICVFNHTEESQGSGDAGPRPTKPQRSRQPSPSPIPHTYDPQPMGSTQQARHSSTGSTYSTGGSTLPGFSAAVAAPQAPLNQQEQQQVPAAVPSGAAAGQVSRAGGPSRPGCAPCKLLMVRGFCPQGERCPFDHPSSSGGHAAINTPAVISPGVQKQQQLAWGTASASSSRSASPLPGHLHPQQHQQQQQQWASESDTPQQQQQRQSKEGGKQHKREFPSLGVNAEGYPMYRGAPNCPFYMGTGRCDFGLRCKFHQPADCMHPECVVMEGYMPRKFDAQEAASYGRLVNHLQRLWQYEACDEAVLKVWLAHHLLARENTGCRMFSPRAALPAREEHSCEVTPSPDKPGGAYSCTLKESDQVLQLLWKAQPDAAASNPMPYMGHMHELLLGDPYLDLLTGQGGKGVGVKLRVTEIKKLLNF